MTAPEQIRRHETEIDGHRAWCGPWKQTAHSRWTCEVWECLEHEADECVMHVNAEDYFWYLRGASPLDDERSAALGVAFGAVLQEAAQIIQGQDVPGVNAEGVKS